LKKRNKYLVPYLFTAPTMIIILVLFYYPTLAVVRDSFFQLTGAGSIHRSFIGFENYSKLLHDPVFWKSLKISVRWVLATVTIEFLGGFAFAVMLNRAFRGQKLIRTIIISPYAISGILTSTMFFLLFNQHIGVLNDILMRLGIISKNIAWLGSPKYAFWSVVMAEAWRGLPFFTIILSAALQTIPQDVYESAQVDGASALQRFTKITLPLMKRTIIFSCLLRSVWEFNNIDVIYALTSGGPANKTTTSAMYLIRTAIEGNNFGYGSAIAVASLLFLVLCSLVVMLFTGLTKREVN